MNHKELGRWGKNGARILLMKKVFVSTVTTNVDLVRSTLLQLNKNPCFCRG